MYLRGLDASTIVLLFPHLSLRFVVIPVAELGEVMMNENEMGMSAEMGDMMMTLGCLGPVNYRENGNDYDEPTLMAMGERMVSRPLLEIQLLKVRARSCDASHSCCSALDLELMHS